MLVIKKMLFFSMVVLFGLNVGNVSADDNLVHQIKVTTDKAPDFSSREALIESITKDCKTNDDKAIAIYNLAKIGWYHRGYPREAGGISVMKYLNVYGWALCGGQHAALSGLWVTAGFEHRFVSWPGHTTVEVKYDGTWHYFDTFMKFFTWRDDPNAPNGRTVASQADIAANPELVTKGLVLDKMRNVYYFKDSGFKVVNGKANIEHQVLLNCGDTVKGAISGCKKGNVVGSPAKWMGIKHDEGNYTTDVNLGVGWSLELLWKAIPDQWYWQGKKSAPRHTCGNKEFRNCPVSGPVFEPYIGVYANGGTRSYANGILRFAPDLSNKDCLKGVTKDNVTVKNGAMVRIDASKPGSITVPLQLPYVFVSAKVVSEDVAGVSVSFDSGESFNKVDLANIDKIKGAYSALLRLDIEAPVKSLVVEAIVQHNRGALPYLSPGKNLITVTAADAKELGSDKLCITYAYSRGERRWSLEQFAEKGYEIAKAHKASWTDTPTVVQKIFKAKDLPATFEIDIATKSDKYPVYPRMLFLRREVLGKNQKPMALPENAVEAKIGAGEELKTLPYPFLIGTKLPPKEIPKPTTTNEYAAKFVRVVDDKGGVYENNFIKTVPKGDAWWVMLVDASLENLPAVDQVSAARLYIPVVNSHRKANVKVGVYPLNVPLKEGMTIDDNMLGKLISSVVVAKQPKPSEAKYYALDITKYVKGLAKSKSASNGLGVKVIPNRGVDDGYTVRIDVTKDVKTYIEIDTFIKENK